MTVNLQIFIQGRPVPLVKVEAWENRRAAKVLRKLGVRDIPASLAERRALLLVRKEELGHDGIRALLARELTLSGAFASLIAKLSLGRRRYSVIDIVSPIGNAEGFARWFEDAAHRNREDVMIAAMPDHYLIATNAGGQQEVIESNGGAPLAAHFFVDYADLSSLRSLPDPDFPVQVAGVARAPNGNGRSGMAIGGVRHQFRDEESASGQGFRARLTVEFPTLIMPGVVSGHRWHLAVEFSNWIKAYLAEEAT